VPVSPSPLTTYINNYITITTYRYVIKVDFWIYVNSNLLTAVPVLIEKIHTSRKNPIIR
jgi:hypothetical protein